MKKILVVFGTRPEAIKLAPVIDRLRQQSEKFELITCVTSQHQEMLQQVLKIFDIKPDFDFQVMKPNQDLTNLTANILNQFRDLFDKIHPDWLLVQGDTTTTFAASLAAFYQRIRVGHVEAGLRTHDKWHPYPEEMNRQLTGVLADLHFAATDQARENLVKEGVPDERIFVTGNTVIDALLRVHDKIRNGLREHYDARFPMLHPDKKMILVTSHRRESFGESFREICLSLRNISRELPEAEIVYPVHLNPNIWKPAHEILGSSPGIHLMEPVDYGSFVYLMDRSYLILTDSGGIQEEAPTLGKPILVVREKTERPEGILAGTAKVVGRRSEDILRETKSLFQNPTLYKEMAQAKNPYGDGKASERILSILESYPS